MKVLLVSSSGGHEYRMMQCVHGINKEYEVHYASCSTGLKAFNRNYLNLIHNSIIALQTLASFRPEKIVIFGDGACIPFMVLARLHVKMVYIESPARITSISLLGRIATMLRIKTIHCWPEQENYWGYLL